MQARVQSVNQVLFGWFTIPDALEVPLDFNVNPLGNRMRSEKRIWNDGKQRLKLVRFWRWIICQTLPMTWHGQLRQEKLLLQYRNP